MKYSACLTLIILALVACPDPAQGFNLFGKQNNGKGSNQNAGNQNHGNPNAGSNSNSNSGNTKGNKNDNLFGSLFSKNKNNNANTGTTNSENANTGNTGGGGAPAKDSSDKSANSANSKDEGLLGRTVQVNLAAGKKYWISEDNNQLSFFKASEYCASRKEKFLSVENEAERAEVTKLMKKQKVQSAWSSGAFNVASKQWIWFGLKKPMEYHPWQEDHYKTDPQTELVCATFEIGVYDEGIKPTSCANSVRFICES